MLVSLSSTLNFLSSSMFWSWGRFFQRVTQQVTERMAWVKTTIEVSLEILWLCTYHQSQSQKVERKLSTSAGQVQTPQSMCPTAYRRSWHWLCALRYCHHPAGTKYYFPRIGKPDSCSRDRVAQDQNSLYPALARQYEQRKGSIRWSWWSRFRKLESQISFRELPSLYLKLGWEFLWNLLSIHMLSVSRQFISMRISVVALWEMAHCDGMLWSDITIT